MTIRLSEKGLLALTKGGRRSPARRGIDYAAEDGDALVTARTPDGFATEAMLYLAPPPSVNHYWVRNANGGMRVSPAGVAYKAYVQRIWLRGRGVGFAPGARLWLEVAMMWRDNRARDADNHLKSLQDALQHAGVYRDDRQITRLWIDANSPPRRNGKFFLRISIINNGG